MIFLSCGHVKEKDNYEHLELLVLGIAQNVDTIGFSDYVLNYISRAGAEKYFSYHFEDSIQLKLCKQRDNFGEIIYPFNCDYYLQPAGHEIKSKMRFFANYVENLKSGKLIPDRLEDYNCCVFGGWLAIYTNKLNERKYFIFDCYGLPDSIHALCIELNSHSKINTSTFKKVTNNINTDSIVQSSLKYLEKDLRELMPKHPQKFKSHGE